MRWPTSRTTITTTMNNLPPALSETSIARFGSTELYSTPRFAYARQATSRRSRSFAAVRLRSMCSRAASI